MSTSIESARAEATKQGIDVRQEGDSLVYSCAGTDLMRRKGFSYELLIDSPTHGQKKGKKYQLAIPFDESARDSAGQFAVALGLKVE